MQLSVSVLLKSGETMNMMHCCCCCNAMDIIREADLGSHLQHRKYYVDVYRSGITIHSVRSKHFFSVCR